MDAESTELLIEARGLGLVVEGQSILEDVDLALHRGEIITVIGPNGAGKSTLVRLLLGLERPTAGQVWRRPGLRIGYVPQRLQVSPVLPLAVERFLRLGNAVSARQVSETLKEVGAGSLASRALYRLSGGELQRVLLARALLRQPDLLVLDEPAQGVDVAGQASLYRLIAALRDRHGYGVLMVSHDLHLVMAASDSVLCLNHHVCCHGQPEAISRHPEYLRLIGDSQAAADGLAFYRHAHDHCHTLAGTVEEADKHG
ncbi:MAG: metal ABC transporter ATP-binding protein [Gammaproteobacteria bacterium]|nr:MAG: metal ABC transporter ATP-binding protein [Gammaproteobacteria bacterium]